MGREWSASTARSVLSGCRPCRDSFTEQVVHHGACSLMPCFTILEVSRMTRQLFFLCTRGLLRPLCTAILLSGPAQHLEASFSDQVSFFYQDPCYGNPIYVCRWWSPPCVLESGPCGAQPVHGAVQPVHPLSCASGGDGCLASWFSCFPLTAGPPELDIRSLPCMSPRPPPKCHLSWLNNIQLVCL